MDDNLRAISFDSQKSESSIYMPLVDLSPRQSAILRLSKLGLSSAEIAQIFDISVKSVSTHLLESYKLLGTIEY
jgi:DNA-binding CsgD family transcriptional regulator